MAVSKRLRYEILRRDNHACRYCGSCAPDAKLTIDHVVPVALGGSDEATNLVTACADCNAGKTSSSPDAPIVDDVSADALRWAAAMEEAAERQYVTAEARDEQLADFFAMWTGWTLGEPDKHVPLPSDWSRSLDTFCDRGCTHDEYDRAISIAMRARVRHEDRFRYFCGVIWSMLRERVDMAVQILNETPTDPVYF